MEEMIGRRLFPDEDVHHRNGQRRDNRPENLELWSHSQPRGQRVEDKVAWAVDLIGRYIPEWPAPDLSALNLGTPLNHEPRTAVQ
jgi:hypothetical protein